MQRAQLGQLEALVRRVFQGGQVRLDHLAFKVQLEPQEQLAALVPPAAQVRDHFVFNSFLSILP